MEPLATAGDAAEPWALVGPMWLIQVSPEPGEATLLQAEAEGGSYVLCFTSDAKARALISQLSVEGAEVASVPSGHGLDLLSAVCQVGACGIIVDLDAQTHRCAFRRRLTASA